ncbi:ABC transporter ATP-binding protein [Vibrio hangzhouensis]|uniref:Lipopolysaccharide transport system ATP-binding protein n=1 Tax=Vibrio hangzhouensis TaxID=462991 RepID=A0A1H6BZT7_9VIBR|nr:ABC transporter ATP-binding protein [Vibrio hangzhouensis]SEG66224.1 lipopolysaccharide transport system ATP-binding protein [Vibrio hangzhouensis]
MSETVIKLDGISKSFHIYDKPIDRLLENFFSKSQRHRKFEALKNVSFEIKKGETVGLVGANGAGKSTLLQIICGTLTQTSGELGVSGRISALLELGSGFNPEFTGRENIYFFAAMQGMKKTEIERKINDILSFADIGEFVDQPVKTYSSGMYVRLAFAAAIHVEPDILVVDEALAVGDEAFQNKCYSRINALRDSGVTVLFVTHSPQTVMSLCDRAMLFDHGELLLDDNPKDVISCYQKLLYAPDEKKSLLRSLLLSEGASALKSDSKVQKQRAQGNDKRDKRDEASLNDNDEYFEEGLKSQPVVYESDGAEILNPHITTLDGDKVNVLIRGKEYKYNYNVKFSSSVTMVRFAMVIKMLNGTELGGYISSHDAYSGIDSISSGVEYTTSFKFKASLNPGVYALNAGVRGINQGDEDFLARVLDTYLFRVLPVKEQCETCYIDFNVEQSHSIN